MASSRLGRALLLAALPLFGCGDKQPAAPKNVARDAGPTVGAKAVRPEWAEIARLEAQRDAGVMKLVTLTRASDEAVRLRATRALGRVGSPEAILRLRELLGDERGVVVAEAARALSLANVTDAAATLAKTYVDRRASGATAAERATMVEALGRLGGEAELPTLVETLGNQDPTVRVTAALALGRYGRRKLPIGDDARAGLIALVDQADARLRYAVGYALSRELPATRHEAAEAALLKLSKAAEAEVRAIAVAGLAARGIPDEKIFLPFLDDPDWRVRVEAVRALGGDKSTESMRAWLASWLVNEWFSIGDVEDRLLSPRVHAIFEGLSKLARHGKEKYVAAPLEKLWLATRVEESTEKARYTPELLRRIDAANCLVAVVRVRAGRPIGELLGCGEQSGKGWGFAQRRSLAAEVLGEGVGGNAGKRAELLLELWRDADPRVRAAAAAAAVNVDEPRAAGIVRAALEDKDPFIVGSAADGVTTRAVSAWRPEPAVKEALLVRAKAARPGLDDDLRVTLFDALRAVEVKEAEPLLRAALSDPARVVREKARDAVKGLTGKDPGPGRPSAASKAPPADPAALLGQLARLKVQTARGEFVIVVDPAVAPWNAATIVSLAEKKFFDGTIFHRVVPDFVVQGGDPTGSGWGGPGFAVPAEPSDLAYERGVVGIADGGLDTGGSQWFVMHSAAPHLDGRYTAIGHVEKGMDVVDSLMVGDDVRAITVEKSPAP